MLSCEAIKVLEVNIGSKISYNFCSNIFADLSLQAREIEQQQQNKQMGLYKIKKLLRINCHLKGFRKTLPQESLQCLKHLGTSHLQHHGRHLILEK